MKTLSNKSQELLNRISQGETIISDGGTGTYLQKNGLEPGGCPEEFNDSNPEVIKKMAREYFEAGHFMKIVPTLEMVDRGKLHICIFLD